MNASRSAFVLDMYTAPVDVKTTIVPQKQYEEAKSHHFQHRWSEKDATVIKDVYMEDGLRKIPRESGGTREQFSVKSYSQELCKKADSGEEGTFNRSSRKTSMMKLEDSEMFEEDLFSIEPEPEFPGPFDPERVRILYARACSTLNVIPSSRFNHGVERGRVITGYQNLGPLGAQAVSVALLSNLTVTELIIPDNKIGPEGIRALAHLFDGNEVIKVLDISYNELGREGAKILANAIKDNESIQQINAAGNKFDDKTGVYFEEAFKYNSVIRQVDLSENYFCEMGAVLLAKGFEENEAVTHLDLSYNHIRKLGIKGIAKMLLVNRSLMQLDLSWNGIDIDGAMQLGQGLNANISLSVLNLSGCRVNSPALLKMLGQMPENKVLKTLQIKDNPLTNADLMIFLRAIETLPGIALNFIDASSVMVSQDLLEFQKHLSDTSRPGFMITYRGLLSIKDQTKSMMENMDLTGGDPLEVIVSYARQKNLRLMDIFARFDTDKSGTMTRQELIMGVADAGIPLSIQQLDRLVAKLDKDGDGEIDFAELLDGYRKLMRDLHKQGKVARAHLQGEQEMFPGLMTGGDKAAPDAPAATPKPDLSKQKPASVKLTEISRYSNEDSGSSIQSEASVL